MTLRQRVRVEASCANGWCRTCTIRLKPAVKVKEKHITRQNSRISRLLPSILFSIIALGTACPGEAQTGTSPGIITTYAGSGLTYDCSPPGKGSCSQIGAYGFSGDGGPATSAQLNFPQAILVDTTGNLFIAYSQNARVRKITPDGVIHTIAGNGQPGFSGDGGPATAGSLK